MKSSDLCLCASPIENHELLKILLLKNIFEIFFSIMSKFETNVFYGGGGSEHLVINTL